MDREKINEIGFKMDQVINAMNRLKKAFEEIEQEDDMERVTKPTDATVDEPAYILDKSSNAYTAYNPKYGDERMCMCGHLYERHFDSYDKMENVGCKYCECTEFIEAEKL